MNEQLDLARELVALLTMVETDDNGQEFRPTYIGSCRCLDLARIGEILKQFNEMEEGQ